MFGDAGFTGVEKRDEHRGRVTRWWIAMKPGKRKALTHSKDDQLAELGEIVKAKIRAKVEHPFRIIKRQLGHTKTRYRGLAKNTAQLFMLFGLANIWMKRKMLASAA